MPELNITVRNKRASGTGTIVCGNSDYRVIWDLDGEWDPFDTKTMRVQLPNGTHQDVVFTGNSAALAGAACCRMDIYRTICRGYTYEPGDELLGGGRHYHNGWGSCRPPARCVQPDNGAYQGTGRRRSGSNQDSRRRVSDRAPVEETDPTVPEWAKAEKKPTYTAAEVGAVAQTDLQAATDAAFAQAKASGAFDGPKGADGANGKDGAQGEKGADGKTPVRGTDYWTAADKQEIVNSVIAALPDGTEVSY